MGEMYNVDGVQIETFPVSPDQYKNDKILAVPPSHIEPDTEYTLRMKNWPLDKWTWSTDTFWMVKEVVFSDQKNLWTVSFRLDPAGHYGWDTNIAKQDMNGYGDLVRGGLELGYLMQPSILRSVDVDACDLDKLAHELWEDSQKQ